MSQENVEVVRSIQRQGHEARPSHALAADL